MEYVLGGYYRENNTRTLVFPRPTNVPDDAVAQLHIDVGADVVAYVMDTETIDGDVFDSFTALSGLTEYVGGWRASIKYVASNGDIWASGNFELNIKERVDGDEAIISANADVLEALQATALDHEARIAAIEASSGTGSHNSLSGRDAEDAHPISAVSGLASALSGKQGTLTAGDNITIVEDVISATGASSETDPIFTAWLDTDPIPDSPSEVGAEPAGAVAEHNVSGTAHADIRPVFFNPATMTVNAGTINAGTVADLAEVGGTDVSIQELNGSDPLTVTFTFTGVTRLSSIQMHLDYIGGAMHVINVEAYNTVTTNWDILGSFSTTETKVWRSYQIFNPNTYINAGAVQVRLRHAGTGINTHQLTIDRLSLNDGGSGGTGYVGAASVGFAPTGNIAATNVQAALSELDSEKMSASATLDNVPDGSTRVLPVLWNGTQAEYDAISPKVATTYYFITEV